MKYSSYATKRKRAENKNFTWLCNYGLSIQLSFLILVRFFFHIVSFLFLVIFQDETSLQEIRNHCEMIY